jgi:CheY-like chemotaxis protein
MFQTHQGERPGGGEAPSPTSDGVRILVVEDSSDHSELLLRQLRKAHLDSHVKIIDNGSDAWRFLSSGSNCDKLIAIFLDLKIPSLSGIKLFRKIRSRAGLASLPVIVVSSSDEPSERLECQKLRATAIIEKPVTFFAFSKVVADVFHSPGAVPSSRTE